MSHCLRPPRRLFRRAGVIRRLLSRVRHLRPLWSDGFVRLQRSRRSIAAVEFALCAPMLVILLIGTLEILLLYRTEAKLNTLAGNFAQMVANQEVASVSAGITAAHSPVPSTGSSPESLSDLCHGVVDGLQPFPPNGLGVNVASVTQVTATPTYDEWEVDLDSTCAPTGSQAIGVNGTTGARTIARGNGGSTALVHTVGDNAIIVRASLTYPGLIGLILTSNQTMTQTAIARWRYAATTNVTNPGNTPPPSATLEFACSGTGCITNNGV